MRDDSAMTRIRRLLTWTAAALALLAALATATPSLLKWQLQARGSAWLGRPLSVGHVSLKPWALELTLQDLVVGAPTAAAEAPPLMTLARMRVNLALMPLLQGDVTVEALELEAPAVQLTRLDSGAWDIDDLIQRFSPRAPAEGPPVRVHLHDLQVTQGRLRLDDRGIGQVHELQDLSLNLPYLSTDPDQAETEVQVRVSMRLDGKRVDAQGAGRPLASTPRGTLTLKTEAVDLKPYLAHLPRSLPLRPDGGRLGLDLAADASRPADGPPELTVRGRVRLEDLALQDARGASPLGWHALDIELQALQPLARRAALGTVRIEGPRVQLGRDAQGQLTWPGRASAPEAQAPATEPAPAWQFGIERLELADAQLRWRDATLGPEADWRLEAMTAQARNLQWPAPQPVAFTVSTRLRAAREPASGAARLQAEGRASDSQADVQWQLQGLGLGTLAPYLQDRLAARVEGRLGLQGRLQWQAGGQQPQLRLALARAQLDALALTPTGKARGPSPLSLQQLTLEQATLDWPGRQLTLGSLQLKRPALQLARQADGSLDAARWLRPPTPSAPAAAAPDPRLAPPWQVAVKRLDIDQGRLQWRDEAVARDGSAAAGLELRSLQLRAQDFAWHERRASAPARLSLRAQLAAPGTSGTPAAETGWIDWRGRAGLQPVQAEGALRVQRLPLPLLAPYFEPSLPVSLTRAEAGFDGQLAVRLPTEGPVVSVQGDVLLADVHVATRRGAIHESLRVTGDEELLSWQSLALKRVDLAMAPGQRPRLGLGEVVAADLYARLLVTEQGRLNLEGLQADRPTEAVSTERAGPGAPAAPAAANGTPAAAGGASAGPAWPIDLTVESTRLSNARIDFTDRYIRPNYSAQLTELNGEIGTLRSDRPEQAALQLRGRVAGTGLLEITGQLNPVASPPQLDLKARASDIELPPLSPYAGKYAGYAIERGKLSVNVAYRIDPDGTLQASNQLVLNQLTFGERIESPKATTLPVLLAVSLLKDRHGVIDIDLPIRGSLNDPQFSLGGLIVKVIVNLLVKAVTAPFALLFGGGGEELSQVAFAPGTARSLAAATPAIDKVAQALQDRPGLQLTITGSADPVLEREAFQREAIEARLQAERQREMRRDGAPADAPVTLDTAARSRLLKALYTATPLPDKPRNVIGLAKTLPDAEMEALLRRHVEVSDEALRALALQRAVAVRDALVARGLPSERLFLSAPKLHGPPDGAEGWTPHAQLTLSTR